MESQPPSRSPARRSETAASCSAVKSTASSRYSPGEGPLLPPFAQASMRSRLSPRSGAHFFQRVRRLRFAMLAQCSSMKVKT